MRYSIDLVRRVREYNQTVALGATRAARWRLRLDALRAYLTLVAPGATRFANRLFGAGVRGVPLAAPGYVELHYRPGTTDLRVLRQVFVADEYAASPIDPAGIEYIFDLGSNIGLTALLWNQRYPRAAMLCVEPDGRNFDILRWNTEPFRQRCALHRCAIGGSTGEVTFHQARSVNFWASSMRRDIAGGEDTVAVTVPCLTMAELFKASGFPRVDLVKMDIEGAESDVMAQIESWGFVPRYLAVELHDPYTFERFRDDCARVGLRPLPAGEGGLKVPWGVRPEPPARR